MAGNSSPNYSFKEILSLFSIPLKVIFGIVTTLTGFSGISFFVCVYYVFSTIEETQSFAVDNFLINSTIISGAILFVTMSILAILSIVVMLKNKYELQNINSNCKNCTVNSNNFSDRISECSNNLSKDTKNLSECSSNIQLYKDNMLDLDKINKNFANSVKALNNVASDIKSEFVSNSLSKYILGEDRITEMENSVSQGMRIVVLTSQFYLDNNKLLDTILDNIKKGAIYEYLVAGTVNDTDHRDFKTVYTKWWDIFIEDLFDKTSQKQSQTVFCPEYQALKKEALSAKESKQDKVIKSAKEYFKKHVSEYSVGMEHRLITIIMYQQKPAPSKNWKIIIKLPTVSDVDYYAFQVPDQQTQERVNLITAIESYVKPNNKIELQLD